jgi:hypothetical protein
MGVFFDGGKTKMPFGGESRKVCEMPDPKTRNGTMVCSYLIGLRILEPPELTNWIMRSVRNEVTDRNNGFQFRVAEVDFEFSSFP